MNENQECEMGEISYWRYIRGHERVESCRSHAEADERRDREGRTRPCMAAA